MTGEEVMWAKFAAACLAVAYAAWCAATGIVWLAEGAVIILSGLWDLARGKGGRGHF